jgi:hypothetical protein
MSSLRILDVMATIGVVSNCRIRWHADTPSRFGIIMSISTKSYFEPAFILFTASRPSSYGLSARPPGRRRLYLQHCQWRNGKRTRTCFRFADTSGHLRQVEFEEGGSNLGLQWCFSSFLLEIWALPYRQLSLEEQHMECYLCARCTWDQSRLMNPQDILDYRGSLGA